MVYNADLPSSKELNIDNLSRVFKDTTNSYKYIYFLSLLDILRRRSFDVSLAVSFRELTIEMLANAWFPHTYFKLSFGLRDQITKKLDSLQLHITDAVLKFTDTDKQQLRETIGGQKLNDSLMRYVPTRFIRPFSNHEISGVAEAKVKARVTDWASQHYDTGDVPYKIEEQAITIHQKWADYFQENYVIVRGWIAWEWLNYMQRCNPNVPAIANKLFPPQERASLKKQKQYWKVVLENAPVYCLFSGKPITEKLPPLDHYLPWSFVAHDQLWNLIPILASVNSVKSSNLPDSSYHQNFISLQHLSLVTTRKYLMEEKWNQYTESYLLDLKITNRDDILDIEILNNAYKPLLASLTTLAKGQGFASGWVYRF
ncbi:HNH endonuclease domain-containing protein [Candidatus Cyanaurora vandensis]|uniref:HNH endonuclease domain-containing protein n=1 Tax=Candidatus Cyanaurora vandensis TaxID=2714958 RepID=UPI00257F2E0A|nr:HNH endonuclease domain-containing protein [Candidatus Cyanaurora vandensis]